MAHEIQETDRFGETRKNGQRAWHGLGMEIDEGMDAETAFPLIGLDWETELLPVFCEFITKEGVERIDITEHRMHVRRDTRTRLGMVGDGYKPFDNGDLAKFADALAGADAAVRVETAGSLYNSRRVFACVRLPEVVRASASDELHQYIVVSNGHGGFASFSCYPTSVRVVCANTLRWSERDASKGLQFRHTGDFEQKVAMARKCLGIAREETQKFQEQVTRLVACTPAGIEIRTFMELAWEDAFGKLDREEMEEDTYAKMVAKRDEEVEDWLARMENERNSLPGIKGSLWAAFNAVTEYHDHERGRFKGVSESDARVHSNLFGASHGAKLKTFRRALEMV